MMKVFVLLTCLLAGIVSSMAVTSDKLCNCDDSHGCVMLPPKLKSKHLCYQASPDHAKKTISSEETMWQCGKCENYGYDKYIDDDLFNGMQVWAKSIMSQDMDDACSSCGNEELCSILPVESSFPCYQGNAGDMKSAYHKHPLLAAESTWSCGTCSSKGYDAFLSKDHDDMMEIWMKSSKLASPLLKTNTVPACNNCLLLSSAVCSILPPAGVSFPCYQGDPTSGFITYNTDPLIDSDSTWTCDTCKSLGYPIKIGQDPVYNMTLYIKTSSF